VTLYSIQATPVQERLRPLWQEDNLNRKFARNGLINVINAGIPGYTTYQELEFLKIHGLAMKPDIVVLGFVFNDVYEKIPASSIQRRQKTGRVPAISSPHAF